MWEYIQQMKWFRLHSIIWLAEHMSVSNVTKYWTVSCDCTLTITVTWIISCKMLHYYLSCTCLESRVSLENKTFNQHTRVNCGSYGYLSCFMLDTWSQFFTFMKGFWHVGKNVIGQRFMVSLSLNWWSIQFPLQITDHNLIVIPKWKRCAVNLQCATTC